MTKKENACFGLEARDEENSESVGRAHVFDCVEIRLLTEGLEDDAHCNEDIYRWIKAVQKRNFQ